MESVARTAIERVEQSGIIFVDEIDKIAGPRGRPRPRRQPRGRAARHPADRRGHDRQHQARHGADRPHPVHRRRRVPRVEAVGPDPRAAGPLPDPRRARGAGPRRVRPHPHRAEKRAHQAVHRRCSAPRASTLRFTDDAIDAMAELAALVNERTENIGARRLHTVMEKLLDEISFEGPDLAEKSITIDAAYVDRMLGRHRQERRPDPVHPVSICARVAPAVRGLPPGWPVRRLRQEGPAAGAARSRARPRDGRRGPPDRRHGVRSRSRSRRPTSTSTQAGRHRRASTCTPTPRMAPERRARPAAHDAGGHRPGAEATRARERRGRDGEEARPAAPARARRRPGRPGHGDRDADRRDAACRWRPTATRRVPRAGRAACRGSARRWCRRWPAPVPTPEPRRFYWSTASAAGGDRGAASPRPSRARSAAPPAPPLRAAPGGDRTAACGRRAGPCRPAARLPVPGAGAEGGVLRSRCPRRHATIRAYR